MLFELIRLQGPPNNSSYSLIDFRLSLFRLEHILGKNDVEQRRVENVCHVRRPGRAHSPDAFRAYIWLLLL